MTYWSVVEGYVELGFCDAGWLWDVRTASDRERPGRACRGDGRMRVQVLEAMSAFSHVYGLGIGGTALFSLSFSLSFSLLFSLPALFRNLLGPSEPRQLLEYRVPVGLDVPVVLGWNLPRGGSGVERPT